MFWKYTQFESKLAFKNRKNWMIALFFLMIFTLLFLYTEKEHAPPSLLDQKRSEAEDVQALFQHLDTIRFDDEQAADVYELVTQQASLINMQRWYIGKGDDPEHFIEDGLLLNELRLQVHALGNLGIPRHFIKSKDEILQETAMLEFVKKHDLKLDSESFVTSYMIETTFKTISGLLFIIVLLIAGSELLIMEQRHQSIFNGMPISFMQKITSKIVVYFIWISTFLTIGFLLGLTYIQYQWGIQAFKFPVYIYVNENYMAITIMQYSFYMLLALLMITLLMLAGSILLNMVFKHAFVTILIGLVIFLIPELLMLSSWKVPILSSLSYLDFASLLDGDIATRLESTSMDLIHGYIWLFFGFIITLGLIYGLHKMSYRKKGVSA